MSVVIYNKLKKVLNKTSFSSKLSFADIESIAKQYNLQKVLDTLAVYRVHCNTGVFNLDNCTYFSQTVLCRELFLHVSKGSVELDSDINSDLNTIVSGIYKLEDIAKDRGYSPCGLGPNYAYGFLGRLVGKTNLLCSCFEDNSVFAKNKLIELYELLDNI